MNIYVGNLPYTTSDEELRELFVEHGEVTSAVVIMNRDTGRSRGFGFVEMASNEEGNAAIAALNEFDFGGRSLRVNEARPREDRRGGGGNRNRGGGGRDRRW